MDESKKMDKASPVNFPSNALFFFFLPYLFLITPLIIDHNKVPTVINTLFLLRNITINYIY